MTTTAVSRVETRHMPRRQFEDRLRAAIAQESDITLEEFVDGGRRGELEGSLHDLWLMAAPLFR